MVGLEDAREIADDYAQRTGSHWFAPDLVEHDAYWVARVGFVGSMGVVIDKADGSDGLDETKGDATEPHAGG